MSDSAQSYEVAGVGGIVRFDGRTVTLNHRAGTKVGLVERRISLDHISAIELRPPKGLIATGHIRFTISGAQEKDLRKRVGNPIKEVMKDPNAMVFMKKQMPAFVELVAVIEAARAQPTTATSSTDMEQRTATDRLAELARMRGQGLISAEQFQAKQAEILDAL